MAIQEFETNEIVSRTAVNSRIQDINDMFPLSVANGGTGKSTLTSGQILLGNGTSGITSTATLPVNKGGTGGATAQDARTSLGVFSSTVLYNSTTSGTNGNITFNIPSGYELHDFYWLEFYYSNKKDTTSGDDGIMMSKIYRWSSSGHSFNNRINLVTTSVTDNTGSGGLIYFDVLSVRYSIEINGTDMGKAMRASNHCHYMQISSDGNFYTKKVDENNDIYVWRVVGYKH